MSTPVEAPARWEADVALADGGTVHIRPVRPDDAALVEAFHDRQSRESIYFRYFSPMPHLSDRELAQLLAVDYLDHLSLVALLGDEIIGMASYHRWGRDAAEAAFITDDAHHGRGLATVLLEWLIAAAREVGFRRLVARVLPTNRRMLTVFHHTGFETTSSFEEGVVEVELALEPTPEALALVEERGRRAEARSVERLVRPTSVAVIGAGRERGGFGREVFRGILAHDFNGPVYPVNASVHHVASVPSYPSVLDVPGEVDLAVIAVPAAEVAAVVDECAHKRVRGLVVMSAGFEEPRDAATALVRQARSHGMRLIGPESLGIIDTAPDVALYASISQVDVREGRVGFLTQSGTLGMAALDHARRVGLGFSTFIDVGAKADVSGNDVLQYWEEDARTEVIALYLESFGNPRKFTRIARRLSRRKPVLAVKAARSGGAGPVAGLGPDVLVGAMLDQCGVLRVETPTELFDLARVVADQPLPAGRRVGIVSNSRGATNITLDACAGAGLVATAVTDLRFSATAASYEPAVAAVLARPDVDAVIVVYAPPAPVASDDFRLALGGAVEAFRTGGSPRAGAVPVLATVLGAEIAAPLEVGTSRVPLFEFPNGAARVLGQMAVRTEWLAEPEGDLPAFDPAELEVARALIAGHLAAHPMPHWLDLDDVSELLVACGLELVPFTLVGSADDAVAAAADLGPVVLKATGLPRLSKSEAGGVALDVHGAEEVRAAYERMTAALGEAMRPAVVQRMAPAGIDVRVAGYQDETYGPMVTLGLGGSVALANPRLAVRVLPLTDADATRLVAASAVAHLVGPDGPNAGSVGLEQLLVRVAWVIEQLPELAVVEIDPVLAGADSVALTSAKVRLRPPPEVGEPEVRRLSG